MNRMSLRNRIVQAALAAAFTALVSAAGWAYSNASASIALLSAHEERLNSNERAIIEIHKDVREIRDWTRRR